MPPDSASPHASPRPPPPSSLLELFDRVLTAGTVKCRCGGPLCPGTLARAAAAEPKQPTAISTPKLELLTKRREFERELARLINRLSLEAHFGNQPDLDLARQVWNHLENRPLSVAVSSNAQVGEAGPVTSTLTAPARENALQNDKEPTRKELINQMHALATRLGYRITDLVPFS